MTEFAIGILAGALVLASGFLSGLAVGIRRRGRKPQPVRPICACGHSYGAHDVEEGCTDDIRREFYYDNGDRNGWEWVECACIKYTGPEPISSDIWVPQMATLPEREQR